MVLFKKIPFSFEEKEYEIKVFYDDTLINVVAFHDNHPVNGFRHQIKVPEKLTTRALLEKGKTEELIELSKADISEKRWERLLES